MEDTTLPVIFENSLDPGRLPEVTLGNHTMMATTSDLNTSMVTKSNSGRMSPVRGRTMKEYDQQISDLKKENFSLKMRIYYMEERMQQRYGDGQDVFRTNIELQVEIENLKRELMDKQVLLQKAALAMETLSAKHEQAEESLRNLLMSDCKDEMNHLRDELSKANQKCEDYKKEMENTERTLEELKQNLDDAKTNLADSNRAKEELANKVSRSEFDVQTLTGQLKLLEQAKGEKEKENLALSQRLKELEELLQEAKKQSSRKDRDIQSLSLLLQDQSHVDNTSLLEPLHLQDEMEDQKEAIVKKDGKIADLEKLLKDKDEMIGHLEDALRDMEKKMNEAEKNADDKETELKQKSTLLERYKKSVEGLVKSLSKKDTECKDIQVKLDKAKQEVDNLEAALRDAEVEKTKALSHLTSQLTETEDNTRRLKHQLNEASDMAENLIMSLGKKEGELAGFQEKLKKAVDALNQSEEAVEDLHAQLKAERADFDKRLKDQALHLQISLNNKADPTCEMSDLRKQIADLQQLISEQNVELLALSREKTTVGKLNDRLKERDADFELLTEEHKRELAALQKDLQTLKAEINSRDIKIQVLENHRVWVEDHQRETVHKFTDVWNTAGGMSVRSQELSLDWLQDVKMMMDLLRREISSMTTLHSQLRSMDNFRDGVGAEVLLTEIASVQRIYKQLEEGVEKNSRLHQALLNSLRGEQRQSDSPDSNSCQDGGYNLSSSSNQARSVHSSNQTDARHSGTDTSQWRTGSPTKSDATPTDSGSMSSLESGKGCPIGSYQSLAVTTCPAEVIDRSLQTGTSFSNIDRWVQTSPRVGGPKGSENYWIGVDDRRERVSNLRLDGQSRSGRQQGNKAKVSFLDVDEDLRYHYSVNPHHSLTDDAKEDLGQFSESVEDFHNFEQGVYFEDDHFDTRRHDRASSVRPNSRSASSPGQTDAEHMTLLSTSTNISTAGSSESGSSEKRAAQHIGYEDDHTLRSQGDGLMRFQQGSPSDTDEPDGNYHIPNTCSSTERGEGDYTNSKSPRKKEIAFENQDIPNIERVGQEPSVCIRDNGDCGDATHLKQPVPSTGASGQNNIGASPGSVGSVRGGDTRNNDLARDPEPRESLEFIDRQEIARREKRDTDKWLEERSRRASWADELEQYKVYIEKPDNSTSKKDSEHSSERMLQQIQQPSHLSTTKQLPQQQQLSQSSHSPHTTTLNSVIMTATELQDLVARLQWDQALQKQLLEAATRVTKDHSSNRTPVAEETNVLRSYKSNIPRLLKTDRSQPRSSTTSLGSGSTVSEDSDCAGPYSVGLNISPVEYISHQNGTSTGQRQEAEKFEHSGVHTKTIEAYAQITELEKKLQATESTVRLLSKKNKMYLLALQAAGLSSTLLNRSTSESNLSVLAHLPGHRASSTGNLNNWGSEIDYGQDKISLVVSPCKDLNGSNVSAYPEMGSMERARSFYPHTFSQASDICRSPPASILATTASATTVTSSPDYTSKVGETDISAACSSIQLSPSNDNNLSLPPTVSKNNIQVKSYNGDSVYCNIPPIAASLAKDSSLRSMTVDSSENTTLKGNHLETDEALFNHSKNDNQFHKSPGKYPRESLGQRGVKFSMDASLLDHSVLPNITYSSLLESTMMNLLQTSTLEQSISVFKKEGIDLSKLNMEQLRMLVEHLERVNLSLREEVRVHETLQQSQHSPLSPGDGDQQRQTMTEDDLLRQHLIEIKKLRQRLEKLDFTKDPEQMLIFQTHTQQRISQQETMISHLQQQMVEKEEQWQRQMAEMHHELSREKALLVDKLERTITDLQKTIRNQALTIESQERHINDLKTALDLKEDSEQMKEEEIKELLSKKDQLEADLMKRNADLVKRDEDLVKRDKECLEIEKKIFKLELMKKECEMECRRIENEAEEKEKDNERLRKEMKECREGMKCLKEIIVKREKSLQENSYIIQKITSEKAAVHQKLDEREEQVKGLEEELDHLQEQLEEMRKEHSEKATMQADIEKLKADLKRRENLEARTAVERIDLESQIKRLEEEKMEMKRQLDGEKGDKTQLQEQIASLRQKLSEKAGLENQITLLQSKVKSLSALQEEVEQLNCKLNHKSKLESELQEQLRTFGTLQAEIKSLREKLQTSEEMRKAADEERKMVEENLKEREEKVKKRDRQLHHLLDQYKKLEAAFTKQKYTLKEKQEAIESVKRQKHLYEVMINCTSQENKDSLMQELLKELIATKKQVEDLLLKLEQNNSMPKPPAVFIETYSSSSMTSTNVTTTTTDGSCTTGRALDQLDAVLTGGVSDNTPDCSFDDLNKEPDPHSYSALASFPTSKQSPHKPPLASHGCSSLTHSPKQLSYVVDSALPTGIASQVNIGSLFAILKLDVYEKLRKETGESLVILSGVEARLADRLRSYKAKSVSESLEYSTLRETSMSCKNLRVCLEEAARLVATAWVTELPPVDSRGHFYDPVLADQNESLKQEVTRLQSRCDVLDRTVKEKHDRLIAANERRNWETSLYEQLYKTTQDFEQAKENMDFSLAGLVPSAKYHTLPRRSPHKSPRRRLEDTF